MTRAALRGRSEALEGPLLLGGPPTLRVVRSGSVGLFCARMAGGMPVGPRRLLMRLGAGQPLVAVPAPQEPGLQLLAVPLVPTRILTIPLERVWDALVAGHGGASRRVDGWINDLARLWTDGVAPPLPAVAASGGDKRILEPEQVLTPRGHEVVWCEPSEDGARWMGGDPLPADCGPLPLGVGMWLGAEHALALTTCRTSRLSGPEVLVAGLQRLHGGLLEDLARRQRDEGLAERRRLGRRAQRQAAQAAAAVDELVAVLEPRREPLPRETPLLEAFAAVGEQLGVPVVTPPAAAIDPLSGDGGAAALQAIARASGLRTRPVALVGRWWRRDCGPLIGRARDDGRPLALLPTPGQRYRIHDPADRGLRRLTARRAAALAEEAVQVYRPFPAGRLRLVELLRFALGRRARDVLFVVAVGVGTTLLAMLTPLATGALIDGAIPDANGRQVVEIGLALAAAAVGQGLLALSLGLVSMRIGVGSEAETQAALWDRLLSLRPGFFRGYASGDLHDRVLSISELGRALNGATLQALFVSLTSLLNLGLLLVLDAALAGLALLLALVAGAVAVVAGIALRTPIVALQDAQGRLQGQVVQLIDGWSKLRVAGAEPRAYTHWLRGYGEQLRLLFRSRRISDAARTAFGVLPTLGTVCVLWAGYAPLAAGGADGLSVGRFLAFFGAFGVFLAGATRLGETAIGVLGVVLGARRVKPILAAQPERDPGLADPGRLTGQMTLERVVFRYTDDGPAVLDGLDLTVEPGEMVALVGPSGGGKSTVLRLLIGFEVPESGRVLVDGQDLRGLDVLAVRRQLGVVLQSGRLTAGSVFDNIRGGRPASLDEAWEAAADAAVDADIRGMPMGMHTVISEGGGNLSGGQRQRLLIARALIARPRVLLLDEATAALDNRTQSQVSERLARRRVTRVVIAHRLSTIREADRICVIDGGRIVQEGTFSELAGAEGLFGRMMKRQLA